MKLVSIRIITADIKRLIAFYEHVTQTQLKQYTEDFAELQTATATLAIGNTNTLRFFGDNEIAKAAQNQAAIIEFNVANVDADYERLANFLEPYLVQKPTTMPWGNRSLLFRDPDGNLVNFFTPVTAAAINKFESNSDN